MAALALLAAPLKAAAGRGVKAGAAAPAAAAEVRRPDAQKVLADLTAKLRLSSQQQERITADVDQKSKDFDKLYSEYARTTAEEKKWRAQANDLKTEMARVYKDMQTAIRDFLDDDQRQSYDALLAARNKQSSLNGRQADPAASGIEAGSAPAPKTVVKKRKLVKRKKLKTGIKAAPPAAEEAPAAAPSVDEGAPAAVSDAGADFEEDSGQVMVDKEPAAAQAAAGPRKKRVLKKKIPAPAPAAPPEDSADSEPAAPAEDIMANEPAGAKPTGKEAPADEAEDAGSYP